MKIAWHYTSGRCHRLILESGELRPTTVNVAPPERGILWFSLNQRWEPTATKGMVENGVVRGLSMLETRALDGGLYRFGIQSERLLRWQELQVAAKTPRWTARDLEKTAKAVGSNPALWRGVIHPIPLADIVAIQRMDEAGAWLTVGSSLEAVGPV